MLRSFPHSIEERIVGFRVFGSLQSSAQQGNHAFEAQHVSQRHFCERSDSHRSREFDSRADHLAKLRYSVSRSGEATERAEKGPSRLFSAAACEMGRQLKCRALRVYAAFAVGDLAAVEMERVCVQSVLAVELGCGEVGDF